MRVVLALVRRIPGASHPGGAVEATQFPFSVAMTRKDSQLNRPSTCWRAVARVHAETTWL